MNCGTHVIEYHPDHHISQTARKACKRANLDFVESYTENVSRILFSSLSGHFNLVVAKTQSAKTGCQLALAHAFAEHHKISSLGILFLQNISQTSLKDQMEDAIKDGGFAFDPDKIAKNVHFYPSEWNENIIACPIMLSGGAVRDDDSGRILTAYQEFVARGLERIIIILDETHIAVKSNSQLDKLNKIFGVENIQDICDVFGFTATPDIFLQGNMGTTVGVRIIPLKTGSNYCGISEMVESGRINVIDFEDFSTLVKNTPPLKKEIVKEKLVGGGVIIFRIPSELKTAKQQKAINANIERLAKARGAKTYAFDCDSDNIDELKDFLDRSCYRGITYFVLIKGALSAGDDLTKLRGKPASLRRNIKAWFECRFKSANALVQSIGRNTGYDVKDTYPIFVSHDGMKSIQLYIDQMDKISNGEVPESLVKRPVKRINSKVESPDGKLVVFSNLKDARAHTRNLGMMISRQDITPQLASYRHKEGGYTLCRSILKNKMGRASMWAHMKLEKLPKDAPTAEQAAQAAIIAKTGAKMGEYVMFKKLQLSKGKLELGGITTLNGSALVKGRYV